MMEKRQLLARAPETVTPSESGRCCGHMLTIFHLALLDGVNVVEHYLARGGVFHPDTISSTIAKVHDTDIMETVSTVPARQQGS